MAKTKGSMSGFRDLLATELIPRQRMIETIKEVYESYGFLPLDTPAIERFETLTGKYGEEGEKLIYQFEDHGGRKVALRYDLTVPLARVVAQYKDELVLPYKRYQVGNVWRGESPQAGRYREFLQFDADIVGAKSSLADSEIVMMMADAMQALGVVALISVNNRRILDALSEKLGLDSDASKKLFLIIDKTSKLGKDKVLEEIKIKFGDKVSELVLQFLSISGSSEEKIDKIKEVLGSSAALLEGTSNLEEVFSILKKSGYGENLVVFDPTIARGLDYYTGIIYETYLLDLPEIGSVCSGGRFDKLISLLSDGKVDLPAVGTSVGVDRLFSALEKLGKVEKVKTNSKVLVVNFSGIDPSNYSILVKKFRAAGIPAEVYYDSSKLDKQFKYADSLGIPWVVMLGEDEIKKGLIKVKNLETGDQKLVNPEDFISSFKK